MVEGLIPNLIERGISESGIHSDPFYYSQDTNTQSAERRYKGEGL
jgi:hypothetical protein